MHPKLAKLQTLLDKYPDCVVILTPPWTGVSWPYCLLCGEIVSVKLRANNISLTEVPFDPSWLEYIYVGFITNEQIGHTSDVRINNIHIQWIEL